jgi:F0F1-type ATP synthase assembly protein I
VFDLAAKRQLNRGYSDGLSRAFEIVLTPLILGFLGRLVDGWLDTRPGFMIGFAALGVVGVFVKLWIGYDREMRAHEAQLPGGAGGGGVGQEDSS